MIFIDPIPKKYNSEVSKKVWKTLLWLFVLTGTLTALFVLLYQHHAVL